MMAGLYIVIARGNLIKKLIGLGIFQTSVYLLYIAPGKLIGGTAPIVVEGVQGLFEPAAARADPDRDRRRRGDARARPRLVVRIHEAYGTIEEDEILEKDAATPDEPAQ